MEKCKRMKRQLCMSQNWIYSWLWKSSRTRQQYCRSESFAMITDILMNASMVKKHLIWNGIRIQCNTEKLVQIVVPGISTRSSSGSYLSTSMTPTRQERHRSTSSSSSSSSPTTARTYDSETRGKIWWMMKFLSAETHSPVLLMEYL